MNKTQYVQIERELLEQVTKVLPHNAKTEAVKITHRPNLDTGDK
jgi:hypothetical protein